MVCFGKGINFLLSRKRPETRQTNLKKSESVPHGTTTMFCVLEYPASSIHRFPYDIVFGNVLRVLVIPRFIRGLAHGGAPIRGID